jgi:aminoglycoside phosphotransferase (APT) family kinase protein
VTDSLTKYALDRAELDALVRRAFGPDRTVKRWSDLDGGTYNAVFAVALDDGRDLILKVAPRPDLVLLTHEVDLLRTEADFYRRAGSVDVPVPAVVFADFDRTVIGTDYLFMSRIPGVPFNTVRDTMTPEQQAGVRRQVSTATVALNQVTGTTYGYPLRGSRSWQPTWRGAFGAMVDDLLADAVRLGTSLPVPPDAIGDLIRRHADVLDEVHRPALVHFDLWDGNVFISPDPDLGWRLEGFIDGERAFYGDPVAELCSLALFRVPDEATLAPFGELTPNASRRLALYTTYLYVIMAIEGATRGWHTPERREYEAWLNTQLADHLATL